MSKIISFFIGIKNLFVWFPIIWKTRDWNFTYGINLFIFFIKRLRNNISKSKNHPDWEISVQRIDRFLRMYEFYINSGYFKQYEEQLKKEGILETSHFLREDYISLTKEQEERRLELLSTCINKHNKLSKLIWKYLETYLLTWWD